MDKPGPRETVMSEKKETGNFADKKREEQSRGVIVAGPDAHENEKNGKAPSGKTEISSPERQVPPSGHR